MEAILTELVLHANGKYTFSHLLNTLDELKRTKKITTQQHEDAYKKMIQESRKGDKWYEKYVQNVMFNNFSFDLNKNDENDPKFANQSEKKTAFVSKSTDSHKFISPPMFVTPPTFETRYSRQSDYQSEHQKKLTNLILQQMQEQSEKKKVNQSIDNKGFEKLRNFYNRKVLQHYRFIFNKLIYLLNEPIKITRFSTKDKQVVEKLIIDFLYQRDIKTKFDYFDCLKQNWIRKKRLHVIENAILSLRKTRYLQRSFYKLKNYSCKHKIRRFYKSQASYQFIKNNITKVWSQWIIFHHTRLEKNLYNKVLKKYVSAKHHTIKQESFLKLKKYYQKKKNVKCEDLLSIKVHNRKVCKFIFNAWNIYVKEINVNKINNALLRRGFNAFYLNRDNNIQYRIKFEQAINHHRKSARRQTYIIIRHYYNQTQKKKIFRLTLNQFHETQIQKLVLIGFKKALVNRHIKRKLNRILFNYLITRYLKNPLQVLRQYKEHRDVKTQLKLKVQSIYANKVTKEVFFGLKYWFYLRKYHQRRDRELLPQINTITQKILIKRLQKSYQQALSLKKFILLIRNKHSRNILKELKIKLIRFKQQNKYPLKIKGIVFNSFKLMMKRRFQKQVFQNQLFSLHHMNLLKKSFLHLKQRGQYYHQKQINIRTLKRYLLGKYIAAPFFSWLETKRKNKYRRIITQNSYKLRVIKLYQKSFKILNNYRWKKKLQKVKDQQNVPALIKLKKLKTLKFWQRKLQSAFKIHNFCNNFENMQLRILFKHMKLIKLRDFQKKKIMKQGRLIFLMRRAFKHLSGYRNMKHRDYRNTELIIQRQEHRLKLNAYNQMKRIFTAEQNIAYLTAFTILDIKRTILTKYFEGFKHMIQAKKRPRDYNLKIKRTRNYFKIWKRFVQRQQATKELYKVLAQYKNKQKQRFINKLSKNSKLTYAKENLQFRKLLQILLNWRDMAKIKQKTIYFQKVLRLVFQTKKQEYYNNLKIGIKLKSVEQSIIFNKKQRLFNKWRKMQIKRQQSEAIYQILESQIQKRQQKSLQILKQNSISEQIKFNKLFKIFKQWNRFSHKNLASQKLVDVLQNIYAKGQQLTFQRLIQYNQRVQFQEQKQFNVQQNTFNTWRSFILAKNNKAQACHQFIQLFKNIVQKNFVSGFQKIAETNKIKKMNMRKQQIILLRWRKQVESRQNIRVLTQSVKAVFQKMKNDSFNILKYNQKKQQAINRIYQIIAKNIQSPFTKQYFKKQAFMKVRKLNQKIKSIQMVQNTIQNYFKDQKWTVLNKLCRKSKDQKVKQNIRKLVKQRFISKWFKQTIKMQATQKLFQLLPLVQNMHNLQNINLKQKFFNRLINNLKIQVFQEQKNSKIIRQYFYSLNILRAQKTGVSIIAYNLQQMINNYTSHNLEVLKKQILKNQYYIQKIKNVSFKLEKQALIEDLKSLNLYITNRENKIQKIKQSNRIRTLSRFFQFYITKFNLRQLQYEGIDKVGDIHLKFMRRQYGMDFIKNLKLLKKQVQQREAERNIHLRKAVFTSWKMMAEEKKMLRKYLEESEKYELHR